NSLCAAIYECGETISWDRILLGNVRLTFLHVSLANRSLTLYPADFRLVHSTVALRSVGYLAWPIRSERIPPAQHLCTSKYLFVLLGASAWIGALREDNVGGHLAGGRATYHLFVHSDSASISRSYADSQCVGRMRTPIFVLFDLV